MEKTFVAIDLKSFYASVECVDRGLDPLLAKLVVADESRTEKTICLAVSPKLKELGIPGRARLYEVFQKIDKSNFIIASPRMRRYMEVSSKIFSIYAKFVSSEDMHVYSIDEVFIDATPYLRNYKMNGIEFARMLIDEVYKQTGITATAGVGTNLFLAKVAMDIEAKHMAPDKNGARIAELNERSFRERLWTHEPITDFWRIGKGYAKRLRELGIKTMGDTARYSISGSKKLYGVFGVNAELLIDHAWGVEPTQIADIKNVIPRARSLSSGQVLKNPYSFKKAKLIVREMADQLALELTEKGVLTDQIVLLIGYDKGNMSTYVGEVENNRYGQKVPKGVRGSINLKIPSSSSRRLSDAAANLFDKIANPALTIRRIHVICNHVASENGFKNPKQADIFTDYVLENSKDSKDLKIQKAQISIRKKYGKNAILKAMNLEEGATMIDRNRQVGGHHE